MDPGLRVWPRDAPVVCWPGMPFPCRALLPWDVVGFVGDWTGKAPPGAAIWSQAIMALVSPGRGRCSRARGQWSPRELSGWLPVGGLLLLAVLTSPHAIVDSS